MEKEEIENLIDEKIESLKQDFVYEIDEMVREIEKLENRIYDLEND